jgi:YD repeat-containing protein
MIGEPLMGLQATVWRGTGPLRRIQSALLATLVGFVRRHCTAVILLAMLTAALTPVLAQPSPQGETRLACVPWDGTSGCLTDPRPPLATDSNIDDRLEEDRVRGCEFAGPDPIHGCEWAEERVCPQPPFVAVRLDYCTRHYWSSRGSSLFANQMVSCNYTADMTMIDYNRCTCPAGMQLNEESGRCELDKWLPDQTCTVGHPVVPATGAKVKEQTDYTGAGAAPLSFVRSYNSDPRMGWTHNWAKRLDLFGHPFVVWAYRGSTQRIAFKDDGRTGTAYLPAVPWRDRLYNTLDSNGNISGWTLRIFEDDSREHYDAYGRLLSVEMRNGWRYTLTYKGGRLDKVTNPFGRSLGFRYNADGRMSRLIDPAGGEIAYGYNSHGNPNRVTWQDKKFRRYHYEDKRFPELLTGITDEADVRVETYRYDEQRRVVETSLAGGVDRLTFDYTGSYGNPQTVVTEYTDTGSTSSTYRFGRPASGLAWAPNSITAPCSLCGNTQATTTYDSAGRVFKAVAHDDTVTFYQYDATGRETERATFPESFGGSSTRPALEEATRVVSTRWHATWNMPREVAEPNKITEYGYDGKGNVKSEVWSATKDDTGAATFDAIKTGNTFTTERRFNANGLMKSSTLKQTPADRKAAVELSRWSAIYDANGDLEKETKKYTAADPPRPDEITRYTLRRPDGLPKRIVTADGRTVNIGYEPRLMVKDISVETVGESAAITRFTYNDTARVKKVQLADDAEVFLDYTPLGRLEAVRDNSGNRFKYSYTSDGFIDQRQDTGDATALNLRVLAAYDPLGWALGGTPLPDSLQQRNSSGSAFTRAQTGPEQSASVADALGQSTARVNRASCVAACVAVGTYAGAAAGRYAGGAIGGTAGGVLGSAVPGIGTVALGSAGAVAGGAGGGRAGAWAGSFAGAAVAAALCPDEDECEKKLNEEDDLCVAIAGTRYGAQGIKICQSSAMQRYAECLRFGIDGIKTPLAGVHTPI